MGLTRADDSFDAFVITASPALLRLAGRWTGDPERAQDLLQTTLWKVLRHWSAAKQNPLPYAQRTMLNADRDFHRRRARRPPEVELSVDVEQRGSSEVEEDIALRALVLPMVRRLPPSQRAVVVLRYWEDLSVEQTAQVLGTSTGTVKSQTHRALAKLRESLAKEPIH